MIGIPSGAEDMPSWGVAVGLGALVCGSAPLLANITLGLPPAHRLGRTLAMAAGGAYALHLLHGASAARWEVVARRRAYAARVALQRRRDAAAPGAVAPFDADAYRRDHPERFSPAGTLQL